VHEHAEEFGPCKKTECLTCFSRLGRIQWFQGVNLGFLAISAYLAMANASATRVGAATASGASQEAADSSKALRSRNALQRAAAVAGRCTLCLLRRWLSVGPLLAFWTAVYLALHATELYSALAVEAHELYIWYELGGSICSRWDRLLPSLLLVHQPILGHGSPCPFQPIFESLTLISAGLSLMSLSFPGLGVWGYGALFALACAAVPRESFPAKSLGNLLPPALGVAALARALGAGTAAPGPPGTGQGGRLLASRRLLVLAGLAALTAAECLMRLGERMGWTLEILRPAVEAPYLLGLVLLLRAGELQPAPRTPSAPAGSARAPGRERRTQRAPVCWLRRALEGLVQLSPGVNACNFLLLHLVSYAARGSPAAGCSKLDIAAWSGSVFLASLVVAAGVYFLVEAPWRTLAAAAR